MFGNQRKTAAELSGQSIKVLDAFKVAVEKLKKLATDARQESSDRREIAQQHLIESKKLDELAVINDRRAVKLSELFDIDIENKELVNQEEN